MASFNKFNVFAEDLLNGVHEFKAAGDTIKMYLSNAAPVATNTLKANIAEITAGNGYTAGGEDIQNDVSITLGVASLTGVDDLWTATGGAIAQFRYVILYNDTTVEKTDPLIGWWDYGSAVDLLDTQTFTVDFAATILDLE